VELNGNELTVKVGSVPHPMTEEHHIEWIYLFLENGGQRRILSHTGAPEATFNIEHGKPFAVFEYCNLHGLWTADIDL
jgi:superoxide reductase